MAQAKNRLKLHAIGRSDSYGGLLDDIKLICISCDTGTNNVPIANAQTVTVDENSLNNSIVLTGEDADGDALSYSFTNPSSGSLDGQAPNLTLHTKSRVCWIR